MKSVVRCLALVMWGSSLALSVADNIVSSPAGFLRYDLDGGSQALASMPFEAPDGQIGVLLSGQLTGGSDAGNSDRVLKWDARLLRYVAAYRTFDPVTGEPLWISDFATRAPSSMSLEPGEGFWIENRQPFSQTLVLAGRVVMDASRTMRLEPGLNLVGYPFTTAIDLESTSIATLWREDPTTRADALVGSPAVDPGLHQIASFRVGEGYWYVRADADALGWTETRPYGNPFPTNGAPPQVLAVTAHDDGSVVRLSIACTADRDERLDIFYRDVLGDLPFDPMRGWLVAESDLLSGGRAYIDWEDRGSSSRWAPDGVEGRLYLVARADVDSDGDGVSDARELYIHRTDPAQNNGFGNAVPTPGEGEEAMASPDGSEANETSPEGGLRLSGCIVYVDGRHGHDGFTGRAATALDLLEGPKRSIRAGLLEAEAGDRLVVRSAHYGEDLAIAGRSVSVYLDGNVDLSGEPPRAVEIGRTSLLSPGSPDAGLVRE